MLKLLRGDSGNVLAITAAAMFSLLLFAALATDISYILTARNQMQSAVDAAALAGAAGLLNGESYATYMAIRYGLRNDCMRWPVIILPQDVTFPGINRIRVEAQRPLHTFFLHLVGMHTKIVSAEATAELGYVSGTTGLSPWAVPHYTYRAGDRVVIKAGELGAPATNPSFYYPVDYPPVNRGNPITGASEYEDNIKYGCDSYVEIGDVLAIEPGNMVGPTNQGVNYIINQDPNAYWDGQSVSGSAFSGFSSPRIVKIPLYDPAYPPDSGRNTVRVTALAAFFIEGMQGKDLIGVFIQIITNGTPGGNWSLLRCVKLVS